MSILKDRWASVDKKLNQHIRLYDNLTMNLEDELQSTFNDINWKFQDSNKPISKSQRQKLERLVMLWKEQGLTTDYFSYRISKLLKKKNISNLEMLELIIEASYIRREQKLNDEQLLRDIANETYKKETGKDISNIFLIGLLSLPNVNGYVWEDYKQATNSYYASQMKNQVLINLQQNRKLDIKSKEFQKILETDQKRYLNKKKEQVIDKFSGSLDTEVSYIVNISIFQAYKDLGIEQVRFIAVRDEKTSKMCESLDNQLFYIDKKNKFTRYSQLANDIIEVEIMGLQSGINLPPINDGFHYCRSTIIRK